MDVHHFWVRVFEQSANAPARVCLLAGMHPLTKQFRSIVVICKAYMQGFCASDVEQCSCTSRNMVVKVYGPITMTRNAQYLDNTKQKLHCP